MPTYLQSSAVALMTCLNPGDQVPLWSVENPLTGAKSMAVALSPPRFGQNTKYFSIQLVFSAAPGAFTYDIQASNTDVDADYVKIGSSITVVTSPSTLSAVTDNIQTTMKYIRLIATLQNANSVTVVATISR
jgi:hypothetical protein